MESNSIAVTFQGTPLTLLGHQVEVGQTAQDFTVLDNNLQEVTLKKYENKIKLIAAVPSLDTPVCDTEIKRFNDEAAALSKDITILFISMDLPFAQKRFCNAFNIKKVHTLSDHKDAFFGTCYGVLIKELRLLTRAIFILDKNNVVHYVEYVPEIADAPDYTSALEALKKLIQ